MILGVQSVRSPDRQGCRPLGEVPVPGGQESCAPISVPRGQCPESCRLARTMGAKCVQRGRASASPRKKGQARRQILNEGQGLSMSHLEGHKLFF